MNKSKVKYRQCSLEKKTKEGSVSQVSWIPSIYAKVNSFVKLKNDDEVWVDGWKVKSISDEELALDDVPDWKKSITGHRKNTGDSLEKTH